MLHAYTCRHIAEHSKLCVHFRLLSLVCLALEYHMRYQNIYTVTHSFHDKKQDFRLLCSSGGRQNLITIWRWLNITSEFLIFPSNFFSDSLEKLKFQGKTIRPNLKNDSNSIACLVVLQNNSSEKVLSQLFSAQYPAGWAWIWCIPTDSHQCKIDWHRRWLIDC